MTATTRLLFKTSENGFKCFLLMRFGVFSFRRERRALKPIGNRLQAILCQPVKIVPADAEECAARIHHRRQIITIGKEDTFTDLISEAHEGG
jgi:hypothetical protein